jgi:hypothetical protein
MLRVRDYDCSRVYSFPHYSRYYGADDAAAAFLVVIMDVPSEAFCEPFAWPFGVTVQPSAAGTAASNSHTTPATIALTTLRPRAFLTLIMDVPLEAFCEPIRMAVRCYSTAISGRHSGIYTSYHMPTALTTRTPNFSLNSAPSIL